MLILTPPHSDKHSRSHTPPEKSCSHSAMIQLYSGRLREMLYRISVVPPPLGPSSMTISPVSSMIVRMHYFSSILICLPVIFLLKVGLDL